MKCREINYSLNGLCNDLTVEILFSKNVKITESAINKALMIAINYVIENMVTEDKESAE